MVLARQVNYTQLFTQLSIPRQQTQNEFKEKTTKLKGEKNGG